MRTIIIDDNREHGVAIQNALTNAGFSSEFFHYDEKAFRFLPQPQAVRLVFSDLNLGGDGVGGHKNYSSVQAILEQLIKEDNGPFALITWTTFADAADGLNAYLMERASPHCRPIAFAVIDKEGLITPDKSAALKMKVLQKLSDFPAIRAILEWESAVNRATVSVSKKLEEVAFITGQDKFEKRLHQIFTRLAEAEGGQKAIDQGDITHPLTLVLSRLLQDELGSYEITPLPAHRDVNFQQFSAELTRLNAMLHVHYPPPSTGNVGSLPGLVFHWPEENSVKGLPSVANRFAFGKKEFLKQSATSEQFDRCKLVIVDVTPTCDHSKNDMSWRRFIGAILVPNDLSELAQIRPNEAASKLNRLPPMRIGDEDQFLILNSQLTVSLETGEEALQGLGAPILQLREQIYSDFLGWLGRQISRQGYTSFSPK